MSHYPRLWYNRANEHGEKSLFDLQRWGVPVEKIKGLGPKLREHWQRFRQRFKSKTRDTSEHALAYLQGRVTIIVRQGGHAYKIKSNLLSSLVVKPYNANDPSSGVAEIYGKASIQDVTDPYAPISIEGNATLQVTMKDNGEPGSADLIGITIWSKDGELLFSSHWSGVATLEQLLDGGNIQVH